jgi:hypothetical protein
VVLRGASSSSTSSMVTERGGEGVRGGSEPRGVWPTMGSTPAGTFSPLINACDVVPFCVYSSWMDN